MVLADAAGSFATLASFEHHAAVSITPEFLELKGLPPGDYLLSVRGDDPCRITIRITAGKPAQGWIISGNRALEQRGGAPVQVESISADADAVVVKEANANRRTSRRRAAILPR